MAPSQPETAKAAPTAAAREADPAPASEKGAEKAAEKAATPPSAPAVAEPKPPAAPGTRIYSKARFAWIYPAPKRAKAWLGYIGLGGSVPLKGGSIESARVVGGSGCDAWYAVEPRGYVCAGSSATLDPADPVVAALLRDAPNVDSPWPYQYGESIGAPRYQGIPTPEQQRGTEWDLDEHMDRIAKARAAAGPEGVAAISKDLVGVDLTPAGHGPPELLEFGPLVRESRKWIAKLSTVAYTRAFDVGGRTFLLGADQVVIPKDRVKPYPRSEFRGVELTGDVSLPIAFFRKKDRPKYKRGDGGEFTPTGEAWPARTWVALTGEELTHGGKTFHATREPGVFASGDDVTIVRAAEKAPFLVSASASSSGDREGRQTWLDISVLGGTLVAYEGLRPVFATLISPGRGGIPTPGKDPLATAATPVGRFRIDGKFRTATMVSSTDENVVHTEVQFIQNFSGPHALHAAYWHGSWGDPKSGGCVNIAPIDAKRLFEWSEPKIPEGWHGMRATKDFGASTEVVIHR